MKKILVLFILLSAILFSAGCMQNSASGSPGIVVKNDTGTITYTVGIDGEYYPYSFIDKNGEPSGFDVESIRWIANDQGFNVKIQPMTWNNIIPALQANKIDIVYSGMTITPKRAEQVDFSTTYWVVNQSVAARQDSPVTLEDFLAGNCKAGTQNGSSANTWIDNNLIKTGNLTSDNLKLYDTLPLAVSDLGNGSVDVVMFDEPGIVAAIRDKPMKIIGIIPTRENLGVAVRKGDTGLLLTINTGLDHLMKSDKWQELIKKYDMQ